MLYVHNALHYLLKDQINSYLVFCTRRTSDFVIYNNTSLQPNKNFEVAHHCSEVFSKLIRFLLIMKPTTSDHYNGTCIRCLFVKKRIPKCNLFNINRKHFGTLSVNDFQTCDKINIMIKPSFEIPLFKAQRVRCVGRMGGQNI